MTIKKRNEINILGLPDFDLCYEQEELIDLQKYNCDVWCTNNDETRQNDGIDEFDYIENNSELTPSSFDQSYGDVESSKMMNILPAFTDQDVSFTNDQLKGTPQAIPPNSTDCNETILLKEIFSDRARGIALENQHYLQTSFKQDSTPLPRVITCPRNSSNRSIYGNPCLISQEKNNNHNPMEIKKKNLKERRRYKTIIDSIDEIRTIMQVDDWKFDTMTNSGILTGCCEYVKCLEDRIALKQKEIEGIKNKMKAKTRSTNKTSNIAKGTELVDESATDTQLSNNDDYQLSPFGEKIIHNDSQVPIQHIYDDHISNLSPMYHLKTNFVKKSPYLSASKFSSLDYKTIFKSSHIPQIVARVSGKIIFCNDSYLNLTKQTDEEACKRTMFSIVKFGMLPEFYKYTAMVLRNSKSVIGHVSASFACGNLCMSQNAFSIKVTPILKMKKIIYFHCALTAMPTILCT